jgi:AraC-like DNA-binding protein
MKSRKDLPVYCISTFSNKLTDKKANFDIKILEKLVDDFQFTSHPHRHDFYNILFISEGTGEHTIDFVTYEVKPCSIFFLTPGQVHSWNLSNKVKGFTIFFTPEFYLMDSSIKKLFDIPFFHTLINQPYLYFDCLKDPAISEAIQHIHEENLKNEFDSHTIIRAYLDIILTRLARYYTKSLVNKQPSSLTFKIRELESLVEKHYKEVKAPSAYAEKMNISPKHLNEICKKGLNKTVGDLIQERVMLEVKRLLAYSHKNISEIADELNFSDKSYFIRFFKKSTGLTPEQFRANLHLNDGLLQNQLSG